MDLEHHSIDLELFYSEYNIECTFQRSMFPGLVYRSQNSSVVMLIFASGRVVITGGKCLHSINAAWNALKQKLNKFLQPVLVKTETSKKRKAVQAPVS